MLTLNHSWPKVTALVTAPLRRPRGSAGGPSHSSAHTIGPRRVQLGAFINNARRLTLSILADPSQLRDGRRRHCSVCGHNGRLWSVGIPPQRAQLCPRCESLGRHRLLALYLRLRPELVERRDVLHFAPEPPLHHLLTTTYRPRSYVTADVAPGRADLCEDMTRLSLADGCTDTVIANHILEHIPDDRAALAELWRILRPGGAALLTVPIVEAWERTYEDARIVDPRERTVHFGQRDHVRYYGRDFTERVESMGFAVIRFTALPGQCVDHGLCRGETLFVAQKPHRR